MNNVLTGEMGSSGPINNYKLVFIGDINVGKTSILSRFIYGSYDNSYMPTVGIDFFSKNLFFEDKTIRLILWDTAGEERFRSLIPSYLKNADCIIIVFDITNKESFNSLSHWIQDANNNSSEESIKILVGNKIDLENKRTITKQEIDEYINEHQILYNECSAKNGKGIIELFNRIAENLGEKKFAKSEDINIINNTYEDLKINESNCNTVIEKQEQFINDNKNKKLSNLNFGKNSQLNLNDYTKKKKKRFCCKH